MAIDEQATPDANPAVEVLLFMAILTLAVTIHELGHVFAGWLLGFRFSLISVLLSVSGYVRQPIPRVFVE